MERKRNLIAHALWQERKKERNRTTARLREYDTYDEGGTRLPGGTTLARRYYLATGQRMQLDTPSHT